MLTRRLETHVTMRICPQFQSVSSKAQNSVISVATRMFFMLKLPTLSCQYRAGCHHSHCTDDCSSFAR
eukprot:1750551-Karenia_brevis.AAC.1